jgi:hypothetical protein
MPVPRAPVHGIRTKDQLESSMTDDPTTLLFELIDARRVVIEDMVAAVKVMALAARSLLYGTG